MKKNDKFTHRAALKALLATRGGLSLIEEEVALAATVERETSDWVPMWVDLDHAVRSTRLEATAFRAITDDGTLLWYVCRDGKAKGYHSVAATAYEAFADAEAKWEKRREIKRNWTRLKALQRDILLGRTSLRVTLDDAHQSGLCVLGIKGFMGRMGIARRTEISGRLAALLMYVEPQVGFALYQAAAARGTFASPAVKAAQTPKRASLTA